MTTKYAVYDQFKGQYSYYDTKQEAIDAFWVIMIEMTKKYTRDTVYMTITTNEDGSETWTNDSASEIDRPLTRQEILDLLARENPNLDLTNITINAQ